MTHNLDPQPAQPGGPNWGFLAVLLIGAFFWAVLIASILKLISNG